MSIDQQQLGPPGGQLMMKAEEFAELMQISVRTLWRLRSAGQIPEPIRLGGAIRWNRERVLDWISEGCPSVTSRENGTRRT